MSLKLFSSVFNKFDKSKPSVAQWLERLAVEFKVDFPFGNKMKPD